MTLRELGAKSLARLRYMLAEFFVVASTCKRCKETDARAGRVTRERSLSNNSSWAGDVRLIVVVIMRDIGPVLELLERNHALVLKHVPGHLDVQEINMSNIATLSDHIQAVISESLGAEIPLEMKGSKACCTGRI